MLIAGAAMAISTAVPAHADPCEGRLPSRPSATFAGTVRYVGDGDGLCVGQTADPNEWIEVRLADFNAPELNVPDGPAAKAALERLALKRERSTAVPIAARCLSKIFSVTSWPTNIGAGCALAPRSITMLAAGRP